MAAADRDVSPSREDAFVAASSQAIGGPVGGHARGHPWWTPLRVVLALATLAGVLNLLHTAPCQAGAWWSGNSYADLCYSDVPLSYVSAGHAEGLLPYEDSDGRYAVSTDPAPVAVAAWLTGIVARTLTGGVDVRERAAEPVDDLARQVLLQQEAATFYGVYALLMVAAMLVLSALLVRLSGRRPWDAAAFAAAPTLILAATIGWDLLGVVLAVGALYAWSRGRATACGILLGTAVAAATWPVAVGVGMLLLAARSRRRGRVVLSVAVAAGTWAIWQLPPLLIAPGTWWGTVDHSLDGAAGHGSLWRLAAMYGADASPTVVLSTVLAGLVLVVLAVSALVAWAPRRPRLPQVVLLLLVGGLAVWPTYSPQYVLWLLPFAVLARPRWRDLLIWQAGEVLYFLAIWWSLSGASVDVGGVDKPYAAAIVVRVAAELWLAAAVARDVLHPERDLVRADFVTDDPAGGPLAGDPAPVLRAGHASPAASTGRRITQGRRGRSEWW